VPPLLRAPPHTVDGLSTNRDETEEGRNQQPTPTPPLAVEEVGGPSHVPMHTDKLPPRHGRFALRGWWDAVPFQDVAHRLVADAIAQVGQGPHHAVIAPRTILAGHPHHEVFDLFRHTRTANRLRGLRTIARPVRVCAVPSQDGVGLGHRRHRCQGLLVQLLAHLGECLAIAIRERHATRDLLPEQAILRDQVRMAKPELLVNRRSDRPEQCLSVHTSHTPPKAAYIEDQYGRKRNEIQVEACIMVEA
jgi:hypothetical protein